MPKFTDNELKVVKESLFERGKALFMEYGLKKTSIDDIVQVCDISKGSFYKFFSSKEELYFEIFKKEEETYLQIYELVFDSMEDDFERMTKLIKELWTYLSKNRFLRSFYERREQELIYRKIPREIIQQYSDEQRHKFIEIIKAKNCNCRIDPEIIVGIIRGVLVMSLHKPTIGDYVYEDVMKTIIQLIGSGLAQRP
jgi:AcrR family transcriptional regulator